MVLATSILIPLYLYPTKGAWTWVTNAIATYPSLPFTIIVNPDSGPGVLHEYPEDEYISVDQEVETYKYWSTYTKANIAIDGIFFDDAVNEWTSASSGYMTDIASNAHALNLTVTFNPGTIADSEFFTIADKVVMIEDDYSAFTSRKGGSLNKIADTQQGQSSVIIYDFSGSQSQQDNTVNSIVASGVSEVYITTVEYTSQSKMWTQFVDAVNSAVGN
ncbi:hypothetical protein H4I96_06442 [Botrytis cinerea]